jgi:biotin transport system substrate-specific component
VFFAPASGYLIGWPVGAFVAGWVMHMLPRATPRSAAISAFVASAIGGLLVVHVFGVIGLVHIANLTWEQAIMGTLVFVPGDLIKCVLCATVVHTVARGLPDWRFGG